MNGHLESISIVAWQALREARRRRVLRIVVGLTALCGGLYCWGAVEVFDHVDQEAVGVPVGLLDARAVAGSTMLGLAIFGALFLGVVLATFLSAAAVRGDAERGLLQPLLVRPLGRGQYLIGRFLAAAITSMLFVLATYAAAVVAIGLIGDWWPAEPLAIGLRLALAVATVAALALAGSTLMTATANGIFVLMIYGAGLVGGMMGSIGEAVGSQRLTDISDTASWVLPFQALYRDALLRLVGDMTGGTAAFVRLGPLGNSHDGGPTLLPWSLVFIVVVLVVATVRLRRLDL